MLPNPPEPAKLKKALFVSRVSLFPAEHGGAKNIRYILQALQQHGVECHVLVKLHPPISARLRFAGQHVDDLKDYLTDSANRTGELSWVHEGIKFTGVEGESSELARKTKEAFLNFNPDVLLLCDDGLDDARDLFQFGADTGKLIFLAQTIHCLPFGPYSMALSPEIAKSMARAKRIIAPSVFVKNYIEAHLQAESTVFYPPVFGPGPYPDLGDRNNEFITFINPCPWKGSSIFKKIVQARPELEFAVVPTWGTTQELLTELGEFQNLTVLQETSQIDNIFKRTRILLAPSLCQEAFGLVSAEALLRGVPVIASRLAGLEESTLGIGQLVDVNPLSFKHKPKFGEGHPQSGWQEPENEVEPWIEAIDRILKDRQSYETLSQRGKIIAEDFVNRNRNILVASLFE